jgi:hypothetical protein
MKGFVAPRWTAGDLIAHLQQYDPSVLVLVDAYETEQGMDGIEPDDVDVKFCRPDGSEGFWDGDWREAEEGNGEPAIVLHRSNGKRG